MEHTQEPWRLGIGYTVIANDPVPEMPGSEHVEYYGGHLIAESVVHRNARRIVACVNALVGWDTATLERYAQGGAPGNPNLGQRFAELNIARKQRDELQTQLANSNAALAAMAEERDHAWAELRAIREAIGARPEESTLDEVDCKLHQRTLLLAALSGLVEDIQGLMTESEGVAGLHLNGDVAPWQELEAGSRFERISHLPDAVAALFSVEGLIA
ncbi:hypothetical protein VI26_06670 [Chromobacterium sp. LK1]|uniref:hypothetical protein n=1 Tax=Chromobacterium sp. LK1 TaxID=1628193 RepID=UPI00065454F8|nr:hypothetical protein [Chromobacterium sp. LK1]KMN36516.1 hypothetical protein VI26_06670 [Chromobacterium sp. LK1]